MLAFLDRNADLYLCSVLRPAPVKLAASVHTFAWHAGVDVLAAVCDGALRVWYHPAAALGHADLLAASTAQRPLPAAGEGADIVDFSGQRAAVRLASGARVSVAVSAHVLKLHQLASAGRCALHGEHGSQCLARTQLGLRLACQAVSRFFAGPTHKSTPRLVSYCASRLFLNSQSHCASDPVPV